jgi:hypothetical protein
MMRGMVVSHETIREWSLRFGQTYANETKKRAPRQADIQLYARNERVNVFVLLFKKAGPYEPTMVYFRWALRVPNTHL